MKEKPKKSTKLKEPSVDDMVQEISDLLTDLDDETIRAMWRAMKGKSS